LDQLASISLKLNNIPAAREYISEARELHKQGDSKFALSTSLKYNADIEYADGNYERATEILDTALALKKEINNVTGFSSVYELYGLIFIDKKEYTRALDSLLIGMKYAQRNKQLRHMADISGHLSHIYYMLGDYDKAYSLKSQQVAISDSIYNTSTTRKLLQTETLLDIEDKEQQIRQLEHENRLREMSLERAASIRRYLIGIFVLSLLVLGLFVSFYTVKRKTHQAVLESKRHVDELNATKDKLFSIIAHDLRSPFNSILGLTRLLKEQKERYGPEETDKMIKAIYDSAHNSYALLNNLLEWARSQSGSMYFQPEDISLRVTLDEVLALLKPQAEEKGVILESRIPDLMLKADNNMLHTILRNLITNAVKYSYSGDKVYIKAEKDRAMVRICVEDTGIGIPEDAQKNIFNINDNYRIAGTAGEKGTGLGLMICKEFVERHGGTLELQSKTGRGSSFCFSMPGLFTDQD
jgi:signal transduction histidine kinase